MKLKPFVGESRRGEREWKKIKRKEKKKKENFNWV